MSLTRDQILQSQDLQREAIDVPDWGGVVFVRMQTLAERLKLEADLEAKVHNHATLVIATVCDEHGVLLFTDADIPMLEEKNVPSMMKVIKVAKRLNGLALDDVKEAAKNSEASTPNASPAASRYISG